MDTQELQRLKNKYDIVGNDAALNRALETAVAVAPTDLTVLISGESGVGKENIPKIIHQNSLRKNGKYFAVNCGAIPEGTINSELFGHEKGSFTGAVETRRGYFEEADGGTLFLDEIGEMPLATQAMLLRVLQNGEFLKVGSSKVQKTDVRVIAATNVDLLHAVAKGKFREDLYYRLCAIQIRVPALRDRKDDIYLLFRKFVSDFADRYSMAKVSLTHDAISMLRSYRWPGNVRQLKNVAETVSALEGGRASALGGHCEIDALALSAYLPKEAPTVLPATLDAAGGDNMNQSDKQMIIKALLDLKQDVDALKRAVFSQDEDAVRQLPQAAQTAPPMPQEADEVEWQEVQEPHAAQPVTLSLQKAEEDNIEKALEQFKGNRKLAAEALGISERTLYRRLSKKHEN